MGAATSSLFFRLDQTSFSPFSVDGSSTTFFAIFSSCLFVPLRAENLELLG
jgi:hypothetical protein